MKKNAVLAAIFVLTACGSSTQGNTSAPADKLSEILIRETLVIATDADYMPLSHLLAGSQLANGTKCEPTQYSANQFEGFDAAVAVELANRLGVEACFVTPPWSQLVAGHWGDNWDVHIGSMAITYDRMKDLYFSTPYYATPTVLLVHKDNTTYLTPEDLSGKRIGTCASCTFESYLNGTLQLPGEEIQYRIKDAKIIAYENENPAIDDLSLGDGVELDAVMTILPKAYAEVATGRPLKVIEGPLLFTYAAVSLDRYSNRSNFRLWTEINRILYELHASGRLSELSIQHEGIDLTKEAASYDINALNQFP